VQTRRRTSQFKPTDIKKTRLPFNLSLMQLGIAISAIIHLVFLSIHFEPELRKFKDRLPVLEVMLVNTKTNAKPKHADTYAQANLDRGGNTNQDKKMKSALPATAPNKNNTVISANLKAKSVSETDSNARNKETSKKDIKHLKKLEEKAESLMIQMKSNFKVDSKKVKKSDKTEKLIEKKASKKLAEKDAINKAMLEMSKLEALIAKQQEEYQKRPKRKFIGARAKEYRYALYVDKWRQKIEGIGNDNYPEAAKKLNLHGKLQMTVSIKKDGTIEKIELDRSSGHRVLDAAAQHIVELGAPYQAFPDNIRSETDILSITRTWTFTKETGLKTQEE
jgi:protein TonB